MLHKKGYPLNVFVSIQLVATLFLVSACAVSSKKDMTPAKPAAELVEKEAVDPCAHSESVFRCVEVVTVDAGNNIIVNIPGVHALLGKDIRVRLANLVMPRPDSRDPCELTIARKLSDWIKKATTDKTSIELHGVKRGPAFTIEADLLVDGQSIAKDVRRQRLASPKLKNPKTSIDWCRLLNAKK
jgi:hypothetical protein